MGPVNVRLPFLAFTLTLFSPFHPFFPLLQRPRAPVLFPWGGRFWEGFQGGLVPKVDVALGVTAGFQAGWPPNVD